jgi:hypothetical protein
MKKNESCPRRKIKKMDSSCTGKRQEEISQAFVLKFMNVLQPGYRCPCPKTIIKRLELIHNEKRMKI